MGKEDIEKRSCTIFRKFPNEGKLKLMNQKFLKYLRNFQYL